MKDIILLYSHDQDPVCQLLLKPENQAKGVHPIHVSKILSNTKITHFNDEEIEWNIGDELILSTRDLPGSSYPLIINRILDVPLSSLEEHPVENRPYVHKEFYSYLSFALPLFKNITSRPDVFGLGLTPWPLHYQWNEAISLGMNVPSYFYGFRDENPYKEFRDNVVHSLPTKVYDWKGTTISGNSSDSKEKTVFCFMKPRGVPYQVFLSFDEGVVSAVSSSFYQGEHALKKTSRLLEMSRKLAGHFNHKIMEFLFFVEGDGDEITFGMLSPSLSGHRSIPQFSNILSSGLGLPI